MTLMIVTAVALALLGWVGGFVLLVLWRFDFMSNGVVAGWIAMQIVGTSAPALILAQTFRANDNLLFTFGALAFTAPLFLIVNNVIWVYVVRRGLSSRAARGLPILAGVDREQALRWGRMHGVR